MSFRIFASFGKSSSPPSDTVVERSYVIESCVPGNDRSSSVWFPMTGKIFPIKSESHVESLSPPRDVLASSCNTRQTRITEERIFTSVRVAHTIRM